METAVRRRVSLLLITVLLAAGGIFARLVYLQVLCREQLQARASKQTWHEVEIAAIRGTILDREGRKLALSLRTQALFAHPGRVGNPRDTARRLAPLIGPDEEALAELLSSDRSFVFLDRFLAPDEVTAVESLGLPIGNGQPIGLLPSSRRHYPRNKLAVHVLGFANVDSVGVEGIERQYDEELSGDPTVYLVLQDSHKTHVRQKTISSPNRQAHDVILTLDGVLQHVVERELDRVMRDSGARAASAILLDPTTGEILALANRPAADANRFGQASDSERVNRALVHQYEPGSTFKIVTMSAALAAGRVRPEQRFDCENGRFEHRGRTISDISRHRVLSAREILEQSSNVGMYKIVQSLEPRQLMDTIERFGFGRRTGIELSGESAGRLPPVERWSGFTQGSLAYGYEIAVTVPQMAAAFAVIANDGVRVPLHVVHAVRDGDGRIRRPFPPRPERVIDRRIARELTSMMEGVVQRGTGNRARLAGYRVAGKSGTAHKASRGGYSASAHVASFGGFAPVTEPRLVGLVVIDTPKGEHYGGQVAAPVYGRIMEEALVYLRVPRDAAVARVAGLARGESEEALR